MRVAFVNTKSRKQASSFAPWACQIIKVTGGYMAFESISDYKRWANQR